MARQPRSDETLAWWISGHTHTHRAVLLSRSLLRGIERLPPTPTKGQELLILTYLRAASVLWAHTIEQLHIPVEDALDIIHSRAGPPLHLDDSAKRLLDVSRAAVRCYGDQFTSSQQIENTINMLVGTDVPHLAQLKGDMHMLNRDYAPRLLLRQPLSLAPAINNRNLPLLLNWMRTNEGGWDVWAAWIEDRWRGATPHPSVTRAYLGIPKIFWNDPNAVNQAIKRALPSSLDQAQPEPTPEQIEPQEPTSIGFVIDGAGRVAVDAAAFQEYLQDSQLQRDLHSELRSMITDLRHSCSNNNLLAPLHIAVDRFADAIGNGPSELSPAKAVLRGNALRLDLETDHRRREARDPDRPPMPEGVAGALQNLVQAWNIYVGTDQFLDEIDSGKLGPDASRMARRSLSEFDSVLDAAEREQLATADAIETLRALEIAARDTSSAGERALKLQLVALRNFARTIFKLALMTYRAGKGVGAVGTALAGGYGAIHFTHENADLLRRLAHDSPNMQWILEWLLQATTKLPI